MQIKRTLITLIFTSILGLAQEMPFGAMYYETGFTGNLFDLKRDYDGNPTDVASGNGKTNLDEFYKAFGRMIKKGFSNKALEDYGIADEMVNLKYLNIKGIAAEEAPSAFGSSYIEPSGIVAVYSGKIEQAPMTPVRFSGVFDDAIVVLVNGEVALYVSRHIGKLRRYDPKTVSNARKKGNVGQPAYGPYLRLKKGDEIKLIIAEIPGGSMGGYLDIQVQGHEYPTDKLGDPILHPFLTVPLTADLQKELNKYRQHTFQNQPLITFQK